MKIETHNGIGIFYDPKKAQYYTEVVISRKSPGRIQYTTGKTVERVRMQIDRFLAVVKKKGRLRLVWVRGKYIDSHFSVAQIIFQDKESKIITVRNIKGGLIRTVSLSNYKFDASKAFTYTGPNSKIVLSINKEQTKISKAQASRAKSTSALVPFEPKMIR